MTAEQFVYIINGILSDPRDPTMWAHEAKKWLVANGYALPGNADGYGYYADVEGGPAHDADRGSSSAMNAIFEALRDAMFEGDVISLVGHSNGVWLILLVLWMFPELKVWSVHLIAGAVSEDCNKNHLNEIIARGQIGGKVYFYTSPEDEALGIGALLAYGLLGKVGPHNVSGGLRAKMDEIVRPFKHTQWVGEAFEETMGMIAARIAPAASTEEA